MALFAIPFTVIRKRYPASIPYLAGSLIASAGVVRFVGLQTITETVWYRVGDPAVAILTGLAFVGLMTSVFLDEPPA